MMCCYGSQSQPGGAFAFHGVPNIFIHCGCVPEEDELKHMEQYQDHLQEELKTVVERLKKLSKD